MKTHLPSLKERNSQLEVVPELIRGQHPHLKGFYSECFLPPLFASPIELFPIVSDMMKY